MQILHYVFHLKTLSDALKTTAGNHTREIAVLNCNILMGVVAFLQTDASETILSPYASSYHSYLLELGEET